MSASVVEPEIYGPDSPNSFFRDVFAITARKGDGSASERLERYGRYLADNPDTREGRNARKVWLNAFRSELRAGERPEVRAMSSGGASGGALVTPEYLTTKWAAWNEYVPSFALACTQVGIPDYGLQVNVPAITATDPAAAQSSENALPASDASASYRTANVSTFAGHTDISQQLFDRSGPSKFDEIIYAQLNQSMWQNIDATAIAAVIAAVPAPNQITRASATSQIVAAWSDINKAASLIETGPGVKMLATHAFLPPTRFRFLAAQVDNQNRPIWQPDGSLAPDFAHGFMGYRIAATGVYTNGSLPTVGTAPNDQFLVANAAATALAKGDAATSAFIEPNAQQLTVTLRLHCYAAPVVRYPGAAATVTGGAYPTNVTWP